MTRRISDVLGIDPVRLEAEGVYNSFVDIDSLFYVDPGLLKIAETAELKDSYEHVQQHFVEIIRILNASTRKGDLFYQRASRLLIFPETSLIALGYAATGRPGKGIGQGLALRLTSSAYDITKAGIQDPVIFELVGLFETGIGSDRVSDMTISIIMDDLIDYSRRVANNLGIETKEIRIDNQLREVPVHGDTDIPIIFVPKEILTPLPVATDPSEIENVVYQNELARQYANRAVGKAWQRTSRRITKSEIKNAVLRDPSLLNSVIDAYKNKQPIRYDFENDPLGEIIWQEVALEIAANFPLALRAPEDEADVLSVVERICEQYRHIVEDCGHYQIFYTNKKGLRHEKFPQMVFYAIADAYCDANNIDLSREPNPGRGSVDFKLSRGSTNKVTVEVKYSSNSHLKRGYEKQLPIYNRAENADESIYLVLEVDDRGRKKIEALEDTRNAVIKDGRRAPRIISIDARYKPSASKVK